MSDNPIHPPSIVPLRVELFVDFSWARTQSIEHLDKLRDDNFFHNFRLLQFSCFLPKFFFFFYLFWGKVGKKIKVFHTFVVSWVTLLQKEINYEEQKEASIQIFFEARSWNFWVKIKKDKRLIRILFKKLLMYYDEVFSYINDKIKTLESK